MYSHAAVTPVKDVRVIHRPANVFVPKELLHGAVGERAEGEVGTKAKCFHRAKSELEDNGCGFHVVSKGNLTLKPNSHK